MTLPDDFDPYSHLLATIKKLHNDSVSSFIKYPPDENGVPNESPVPDDDLEDDLSNLKIACLIGDDDSAPIAALRCLLFYFVVSSQSVKLDSSLYYLPTDLYQSSVVFQPQIILIFKQHSPDPGFKSSIESQITFRIHGFTNETLTPETLQPYISRLNSVMYPANEHVFSYQKGQLKYCYLDKSIGIDSRLLVRDEIEGEKLINAILGIINPELNIDQSKVSRSYSGKDFNYDPNNKKMVFGKSRNAIRLRPEAELFFFKAEVAIHGLNKNIVIADARYKESFKPNLDV